jgi:hypothetical protein
MLQGCSRMMVQVLLMMVVLLISLANVALAQNFFPVSPFTGLGNHVGYGNDVANLMLSCSDCGRG